MDNIESFIGRQWPANKMDDTMKDHVTAIDAIQNNICQRCGSQVEYKLPDDHYYCRKCIGIGRIDDSQLLLRCSLEKEYPKLKNGGLTWQGQLQERQRKVSDDLCKSLEKGENRLIHAVTGAGKTEMIFPLLAKGFETGKRICIATPRIDVVNELYPRLAEAFKKVTIGKYHGREYKEADNEQLIICTTHQLLKYYHAFDLLIIDEVDSFPYVGDPQLHFAAKNAVKITGCRIYLTATPTDDLIKEVKQGTLQISKLNRRFHGGLLPVPKLRLYLRPFLNKNKLNPNLTREIVKVIKQGHPLLLFVPRIAEIPLYYQALSKVKELKNLKIAGVHAADPERLEKVSAFRNGDLDILITTTILERGVTFKHVWVIILAADDAIYSTSSLVQIAGRVGRAKEDKTGLVLFCYHKYTKSIRQAVKQIKDMNK